MKQIGYCIFKVGDIVKLKAPHGDDITFVKLIEPFDASLTDSTYSGKSVEDWWVESTPGTRFRVFTNYLHKLDDISKFLFF